MGNDSRVKKVQGLQRILCVLPSLPFVQCHFLCRFVSGRLTPESCLPARKGWGRGVVSTVWMAHRVLPVDIRVTKYKLRTWIIEQCSYTQNHASHVSCNDTMSLNLRWVSKRVHECCLNKHYQLRWQQTRNKEKNTAIQHTVKSSRHLEPYVLKSIKKREARRPAI